MWFRYTILLDCFIWYDMPEECRESVATFLKSKALNLLIIFITDYLVLRADDLAFMSFDSITFLGIDPFQFKVLNDELYILKLFSLLSYHKMEQKNDIKKVLLPSTKGPPFESLATCSH